MSSFIVVNALHKNDEFIILHVHNRGILTTHAKFNRVFPIVSLSGDPIAAKCGIDIWNNGDADLALAWLTEYALLHHRSTLTIVVEGDSPKGKLMDRYREWLMARGFKDCKEGNFAMIKQLR